ncbi:MAG: hypothetical protein ACM34H_10690, partial [Deltaproteobacteria bacterium]
MTFNGERERGCRIGLVITLAVSLILWVGASTGMALSMPEITVSTDWVFQGDSGCLRVRTGEGEPPQAHWMDQKLLMAPHGNGKEWFGFFAADLKLKPGSYPL